MSNAMDKVREALKKIYFNAQCICDYRDEPAIVRHRANIIEGIVNAALSIPRPTGKEEVDDTNG